MMTTARHAPAPQPYHPQQPTAASSWPGQPDEDFGRAFLAAPEAIERLSRAHDEALAFLRAICATLQPRGANGRLNKTGRWLMEMMLARGISNKEIAEALGISPPAVTRHRRELPAPRRKVRQGSGKSAL